MYIYIYINIFFVQPYNIYAHIWYTSTDTYVSIVPVEVDLLVKSDTSKNQWPQAYRVRAAIHFCLITLCFLAALASNRRLSQVSYCSTQAVNVKDSIHNDCHNIPKMPYINRYQSSRWQPSIHFRDISLPTFLRLSRGSDRSHSCYCQL